MDRKELLEVLQKCGFYLHNQKRKKLGQYRILLYLSHHLKSSQKDIQAHLRIQAGSISEILLKMEKAGLVYREKDERDKRRILVDITKEGKDKLQGLIEEYERENEILFDILNDEECKQLYQLLNKLYKEWTEGALC